MVTIPPALAIVCTDLTAAEVRVRAAFENRTSQALNWRPLGKSWSVLQVVQHLALANRFLAAAIDRGLPSDPGPELESDRIFPGLVWRLLLAMVEPQFPLKGFAPAVLRPPPTLLDADTTLAAYLASHECLRTLAARCSGLDVNRKRLRHPILRLRMSVGCVFLLVTVHERRHLVQAERVAQLYQADQSPGKRD
ncbi:MAG: DinB family protein [Acidobacteriia bacterium]|nr:DinB family protein [Terriglobia bacterium]